MHLPPLNALRAFDAAARHGSFTLAADELCVTPGAVSRQIRLLEDFLGLALFTRHHRLVSLTPAGTRYAGLIAGPFSELERAGEILRREQSAQLIRLDCLPTLAMHWLLPRLEAFRVQAAGNEVVMQTTTGPVALAGDFDLAIRRDPTHFSGLQSHPMMTEWCIPVCSAAFVERFGLKDFASLQRATVIDIRAREDLWPSWCAAYGVPLSALSSRLTVDHTFVALQAAEDGLGVAVVPVLFAARCLAAGRLVAPFATAQAVSGTYFILHRAGALSPAVQAFHDWLRAQGAATCTMLPPPLMPVRDSGDH